MGETMATGIVIVVLFIYLILMGFLVAAYVLQSLAFHTLARRRGIANPWLAWIPCGNYWIAGALARDHDKQNGIDRRWDKTLLILSVASIASFFVIYIVFFILIIMLGLEPSNETLTEEFALKMIAPIVIFYIVLILVMVAMMALQTLTYVCVYKIFESTVPEKTLKYFLIYLLVPFAAPFCLFACRNKGYQHPDPMAYIYNPVDKNYCYYHSTPTEQVPETPIIQNTKPQPEQLEQPEE